MGQGSGTVRRVQEVGATALVETAVRGPTAK